MPLRLGIDLVGTKIEGIALAGGADVAPSVSRRRVRTTPPPWPRSAPSWTPLKARAGGTGTVGIGIPGTISPSSGLVKNANSTWLLGKPLLDDLRRTLGRDVRIANDANCFVVQAAALLSKPRPRGAQPRAAHLAAGH